MPDQPIISSLSRCLVEGDETALRRARRLRRKALLVSLSIEAVLISAMLLVPLVATSERPMLRNSIPLPPWAGSSPPNRHPERITRTETTGPRRQSITENQFFHPQRIPQAIDDKADDSQNAPVIPGSPIGVGAGPIGITGGDQRELNPDESRRPRLPERASVKPGPHLLKKSVIDPAMTIHRVEPIYPALLKPLGIEGTVHLRAIIGTDGTVQELEVVDGHPILAHAAMEAVRQWRYRPTFLNGQPVEVETRITVVFKLRR